MKGVFWVVIVGLALLFTLFSKSGQPKRRQSKSEFYAGQKTQVEEGGYRAQYLLNQTEKDAYMALKASNGRRAIHVFPQVSLGEVLSHPNKKHYFAINSKRIDFIITDGQMKPVAAVEIHGTGHSGNNAYSAQTTGLRDDIKRTALESAGIDYLSISTNKSEAYRTVASVIAEWRERYDDSTTRSPR